MTLKEIREKLEAKQTALATIFDKAKNESGQYDFASLDDPFFGEAKTTKEKLDKVHQAEAELNDLVDEAEKLSKAEKGWDSVNERLEKSAKSFPHPTGKEPKTEKEYDFKSLGELVVQSEEYTKWSKKGGLDFRFDEMYPSDALAKAMTPKTLGMKTLMSTTAGYAPESIRIPGFLEAVTRPIQLLDIIPIGRTSYENVVYMEETTRTHNAAEKGEGVTFAESAFAFTERTSAVRKITDSLPVTDEQLEDVPFIEGYINDRLLFGLRQRLDTQVLLGDGNAPNLRGIKNIVGKQTQAKGADPTPDAFFKSMTKLRVTGRVMPTHHIIHPSDWEEIRLLRTADGVYIWGNPSEAGPERMWGLPIVQQDADSAGTGWTISAQPAWMSLFEKRGVDTQVGYTGTQFVEGKRTIRSDMRFAFVVFRPAAICEVTGI
jgi:HK97 family phage major capsid protein